MRGSRTLATAGATMLVMAALGGPAIADTVNHSAVSAAKDTSGPGSYVVVAEEGVSAKAIAAQLKHAGTTVTSVNEDIGLVTVKTTTHGFRSAAKKVKGVKVVGADKSIGQAPKQGKVKLDKVEKEHLQGGAQSVSEAAVSSGTTAAAATSSTPDPLDRYLWGMRMIKADKAHAVNMGDKRVKVGVLDTGVQGDHPDLAPNFDKALSRNFTTDMPDIDGACEYAGCVDPANVDNDGHGTHVAGTIGAAMNDVGVSGVAPNIDIVNIRGGQDSGYFFLGPVTNALTYAGNAGLDVVNMSFYVDPWAYNCLGGAPEDTPEEAADQEAVITAMNRALNYAHNKGVTLLGAAGNAHTDMANPPVDDSSPDYPENSAHPRTIDNKTCWDLPVEGPHVLGITSLGPSGLKSDFSNYTTDLTSGEVEFSAPGGYYRDFFGTDKFAQNTNMILSTAPKAVLQSEGLVDEQGRITADGRDAGVMKQCTPVATKGATRCGYYQFLQGTSMATPHATGVAALVVSAHGVQKDAYNFGLAPDKVKSIMDATAINHACPDPRTVDYLDEGRTADYTATCVGGRDYNGFYGEGIVNALGAVK